MTALRTHIALLLVALAALGVGTAYDSLLGRWLSGHSSSAYSLPTTNYPLSSGIGRPFKLPLDGFYRISQAEEVLPKILEANIDPPDVHVGDTQKLSLVVEGPDPITSVEARIELDHGVKILPLELAEEIAFRDLAPNPYVVQKNGVLAVVQPDTRYPVPVVAHATVGVPQKYAASWKVYDTHDAKYHTTFVVKDAKGRENSVTIAWSDACGIPKSGDWNITSNGNCTIASTDGVEGGNMTIATYTLTLNASFGFNPGKSVTVNSGSIAIGSGGELRKTYIWRQDSDTDTYPSGGNVLSDTDPGATFYTRGDLQSTDDCNDSNVNVYNSVDSLVVDKDRDGYTVGSAGTVCVGSSYLSSGRTYYNDDALSCTGTNAYLSSAQSLGADANDCAAGNGGAGG